MDNKSSGQANRSWLPQRLNGWKGREHINFYNFPPFFFCVAMAALGVSSSQANSSCVSRVVEPGLRQAAVSPVSFPIGLFSFFRFDFLPIFKVFFFFFFDA